MWRSPQGMLDRFDELLVDELPFNREKIAIKSRTFGIN
jgi:hypothetical protein